MSNSVWPRGRQLPGSSVHGIFQARVLEWGAIAYDIQTIAFKVYILLFPPFHILLFFTWFSKSIIISLVLKKKPIKNTAVFPSKKNPYNSIFRVCIHSPLRDIYVFFPRIGYFKFTFRSVTQSCPTLCNPMNCSTPGLPVPHQLPEFTQTHIHQVSDAIQPSHPLSSPSPPAPIPPSIRVFSNESTLRMRWPKYWSFSFSIAARALFMYFSIKQIKTFNNSV